MKVATYRASKMAEVQRSTSSDITTGCELVCKSQVELVEKGWGRVVGRGRNVACALPHRGLQGLFLY